eukprot:gnl/TRDRNA2_/TRDRNA2_196619_c0_seq1.p1 gnl/TRDRNA2_/TRDRNA2_196619_c0~~gnl/TRDRNA2_/TRDRNA2_196619_c0_seq1.p1  ORF type:complete len:141 (+),score=27.96 gnl/TRDRNA2_/TRDRNA2_196619_c0_seq1:65-487(+)
MAVDKAASEQSGSSNGHATQPGQRKRYGKDPENPLDWVVIIFKEAYMDFQGVVTCCSARGNNKQEQMSNADDSTSTTAATPMRNPSLKSLKSLPAEESSIREESPRHQRPKTREDGDDEEEERLKEVSDTQMLQRSHSWA